MATTAPCSRVRNAAALQEPAPALRRGPKLAEALRQDAERLQHSIDAYAGPDSAVIERYRAELTSELARSTPTSLRRRETLEHAARAQLVFCGDDHSALGAQSVCRELLRALLRTPGGEVVLVVEFASTADQAHLDAYLAGTLSLAELRARVFARGALGSFPFAGYAELLELAKANRVRLVGADSLGELAERDQAAARVIAKVVAAHPGARVLVQYGQLHLAHAHLPTRTHEALAARGLERTSARVFTAYDAAYFSLIERGSHAQAARIDGATYCVFGAKPRAARKGYLRYLSGF